MINMTYLCAAYAIMLIVILRDVIKKYSGFDINKMTIRDIINMKWKEIVINRTTGMNSLKLLSAGSNKATVMATLRSITGIDYKSARTIVDNAPITFINGISSKEATLTKKALEFVGAKVEILG